ncbi:unnamed protein product, partial [Thlaspi arvense]
IFIVLKLKPTSPLQTNKALKKASSSPIADPKDRFLSRLAPISFSDTGRPRVIIPYEVFQRGEELQRAFLLPPYSQIHSVLHHMWGKGNILEIHNSPLNRTMLVRIPSDYLRRKILEKGLWYIGDSMFHVAQWMSSHSPISSPLESIQIWAHLNGVLLELRHQKCLSLVVGLVGEPVETDDFTKNLISLTISHVKVEVNLTKDLPRVVEFGRKSGEFVEVLLPPICSHYKELGHIPRNCLQLPLPQKAASTVPKGTKVSKRAPSSSSKDKQAGKILEEGTSTLVIGPVPAQAEVILTTKDVPVKFYDSDNALSPSICSVAAPSPSSEAHSSLLPLFAPFVPSYIVGLPTFVTPTGEPYHYSPPPIFPPQENLLFLPNNFTLNHLLDEDECIILIWRNPVTVRILHQSRQSITCAVTLLNVELLGLQKSLSLYDDPWMIEGDFNQILQHVEHLNPYINAFNTNMMEFKDYLTQMGMFDLRFQGPLFTWSNYQHASSVAKKLDLLLVNSNIINLFPNSIATFLPPLTSDQSPCLIDIAHQLPSAGTRPFKFINYLTKHPDFHNVLLEVWIQTGSFATTLIYLCWKQKNIKSALNELNSENFLQIQIRVSEAKRLLQLVQIQAIQIFHAIKHFKAILRTYVLPPLAIVSLPEWISFSLRFENTDLAGEIVNGYHKRKGPRKITIKLDIAKEFDNKSSLFASYLSHSETDLISFSTGMPLGTLPVLYLGVPLCTKKLSISNCEMLISQVKSRVTYWSVKSLSFAWRLLLIKTIVAGITTFWCSSFIHPKVCIKRIKSLCSGSLNNFWSAKQHKNCLWLANKFLKVRADSYLWIKLRVQNGRSCRLWPNNWSPFGDIEAYLQGARYSKLGISHLAIFSSLQRGGICNFSPARLENQVSLQTFMSTITLSEKEDYYEWEIDEKVSSKYNTGQGIPKHNFSAWLFVLIRCPMKNRILGWGLSTYPICLLCNSSSESRNHLLFDCAFSWSIWGKVSRRCNLLPQREWSSSFLQMQNLSGGKLAKHLTLLGWQASIYWI